MAKVDWLVLTAANEAQARGYRIQMAERQRLRLLPAGLRWRVIADPGGRRVGSGGSTLWVLFALARALAPQRRQARDFAALFAGQRILVIHSGGDSRRLVAYAAQGKIFTPLPCDGPGGQPATLFDMILASLLRLPAGAAAGQILIASGDVLLTFDPRDVDFSPPGVVGVAYPADMERGSRHGVYVADGRGRVLDFLQKPAEAEARRRGALDPAGRLLVDTGLVSLDPAAAQRWLAMAGAKLAPGRAAAGAGLLRDVVRGRTPSLDLYEHLLMALPPRLDRAGYLENVAPPPGLARHDAAQRRRLAHIHRGLHGQPFRVNVLPYCDFFHVGTSRELLANVATLSRTARALGFRNFDRAVVADHAALESAFVFNSVLDSPAIRCGAGVLVEAVHTAQALMLPGQNIVVGLPPGAGGVRLPAGWGLVCLPVRGGGWSAVVFGLDDDFKTALAGGGTFGGEPLARFLTRAGLEGRRLWRDADGAPTLWNARLWRVGALAAVLRQTLWMCRDRRGAPPSGWLRARRVSAAELLTLVDHRRLIAHRREIQRLCDLHDLQARLAAKPRLPAAHVVEALTGPSEARQALRQIGRALQHDPRPLHQARLCWLARAVADRFPAARIDPQPWERDAFRAVARSVAQQIELPRRPRPAAVLHDQVVWVTTPVRLDFAGGWSDTPPICAEFGGAVVNAAVTLNGQYPIQVIAKLTDQPRITLTSMDLGQRLTLSRAGDVQGYADPTHWAALPKAALILAGVCPAAGGADLRGWLRTLGGGLDITLFSAVPKGSGLGTSSILGAALLACLGRVVGEAPSNETLVVRTSLLEQMLTTGGGWQDQVGGITPGIKLSRTAPGPAQVPSVQWTGLALSNPHAAATRARLLLYYTGCKRMARNILQRVVGRCLARDPEALTVIDRLKESAGRMKADLDAGDVEAFARGIDDYWGLKKQLDPGSTNPAIEALLRRVRPHVSGYVLPGAGGGGFVFMVARDEAAAGRIRRLLTAHPPNALARFFDFDFDPQGLRVTVL